MNVVSGDAETAAKLESSADLPYAAWIVDKPPLPQGLIRLRMPSQVLCRSPVFATLRRGTRGTDHRARVDDQFPTRGCRRAC